MSRKPTKKSQTKPKASSAKRKSSKKKLKIVYSPTTRIIDLMFNILLQRFRVPVTSLANGLDAKAMKRSLLTVQSCWQELKNEDLFKIVTASGEEWKQGTKDKQWIERVAPPLDVDGVESLHRRLVSLIAMQALTTVRNVDIISQEQRAVTSQIKKSTKAISVGILKDAERKFYAKSKGSINFKDYDELLDDIYTALIYSQKLEVTRVSDDESAKPKVILPLCLVSYNSSLYLAAYSDGDTNFPPRIFTYEVTRFRHVKVLKDKFLYPSNFHPEQEFGSRFGLWSGSKQITVKLRIKPKSTARHHLVQRTWGPNQKALDQADGSTILEFDVNDLIEVKPFVLGYGSEVEALGPQQLRDELKASVSEMQKFYP